MALNENYEHTPGYDMHILLSWLSLLNKHQLPLTKHPSIAFQVLMDLGLS